MKKHPKLTFALLVLVVFAMVKDWSFFGGPVSGVVRDGATGKPLEGAIVVVRWDGYWSKIFGESSSACYQIKSARTDADGRYEVPFWIRPPDLVRELLFTKGAREISIYKSGYRYTYAGSEGGEMSISPFVGTNEQYFRSVLDLRRWHCGSRNNTGAYRAFKAAAADAAARAQSHEQSRIAAGLDAEMRESLTDLSKRYDYDRGAHVNVDPKDSFPPEE